MNAWSKAANSDVGKVAFTVVTYAIGSYVIRVPQIGLIFL